MAQDPTNAHTTYILAKPVTASTAAPKDMYTPGADMAAANAMMLATGQQQVDALKKQATSWTQAQARTGQLVLQPGVTIQPPAPEPGLLNQAWAWVKENPGKTALGAAAAWYLKTRL